MPRAREAWPDAVKTFACIMVVLGHFTQSMVKSGFLPANNLYAWFQMTVYTFHVPLFFICSGYLYQRFTHVDSLSSWSLNVRKKALTLGVPYIFFYKRDACHEGDGWRYGQLCRRWTSSDLGLAPNGAVLVFVRSILYVFGCPHCSKYQRRHYGVHVLPHSEIL